jgi:hypothetical protein
LKLIQGFFHSLFKHLPARYIGEFFQKKSSNYPLGNWWVILKINLKKLSIYSQGK